MNVHCRMLSVAVVLMTLVTAFAGVSLFSEGSEATVPSDPFIYVYDDEVVFTSGDDGSVTVDAFDLRSVLLIDTDFVTINLDLVDPVGGFYEITRVLSVTNSLDDSEIEGDFFESVSDTQAIIKNPGVFYSEVIVEYYSNYSANGYVHQRFYFLNLDFTTPYEIDLADGLIVDYPLSLTDQEQYFKTYCYAVILASGDYPVVPMLDPSFLLGSNPVFYLVSDGSLGEFQVYFSDNVITTLFGDETSLYSSASSQTFNVVDSSAASEVPENPDEPDYPTIEEPVPGTGDVGSDEPGLDLMILGGVLLLVVVFAVCIAVSGRGHR